MRVRKKPWTQDVINEAHKQNLLIKHPDKYQSKWKKLLNTSILHVEIGAGKGDYFVDMSSLYPDEGWVSIERVPDVGAYALRKSFGVVGDNGKFIIDDAQDIETWFDQGEIDVIHLNFSDPWPKRAHHKRRLTAEPLAKSYQRLLNENGQILLKTDNQHFFEDSVVILSEHFRLENLWVDFRREDHPEDAITEYEQKFIDKGQPIYRAQWRKL